MKKQYFIALVLAVLVTAGLWSFVKKDTEAEIQAQKQTEIKAELLALTDFKAWLVTQTATPDPFATRGFLSRPLLDSILSGLDGTTLKLPEAKDVTLTINTIRTDFRPGFPGLSIIATAERSGVTADVSTVARIEPMFDDSMLRLRVHVDSLVPKISWRFINFTLGGLVRDLAQTKVVEAINKEDALGAIAIPLSHSQTFSLPSTQVPFSTTGLNAVVTLPGFSGKITAQLTRIVAMPEGLYVYATLKTGAQ